MPKLNNYCRGIMRNKKKLIERVCGFLGRHFPLISKKEIEKKNKQAINDYMQSYQATLR